MGSPRSGVGGTGPGPFPAVISPKDRNSVHVQFGLHQRPCSDAPVGSILVPAGTGIDPDFVLPFLQIKCIRHNQRTLIQLGNCRLQYGIGELLSIQESLMISQGSHMENCCSGLVSPETLPEHERFVILGNHADEMALHAIQDTDSEALLPTPGRCFPISVPHTDTPPGLLPRGQQRSPVRNHYLIRGFHLPGLPQIRSHLDLIGGLFHGLSGADLPAEMRLPAVDAQRLHKALAAKVIHFKGRLAG